MSMKLTFIPPYYDFIHLLYIISIITSYFKIGTYIITYQKYIIYSYI